MVLSHTIHALVCAVVTEWVYEQVTGCLAVVQLHMILLLKCVVVEELVLQVKHIHLAVVLMPTIPEPIYVAMV